MTRCVYLQSTSGNIWRLAPSVPGMTRMERVGIDRPTGMDGLGAPQCEVTRHSSHADAELSNRLFIYMLTNNPNLSVFRVAQ